MKLYQISNELLRLAEVDDETIDVEAELSALQMQFADKAQNIVGLIRNLEAERGAVSDEANRLQNKAKALETRVEQIKAYLQSEMLRTGQDSIKAGIFKIRLQNSPQSLIIRNMDAIPNEWKQIITETKIDKAGILRHLRETGELIGGVDITQGRHIRIY
jgi:seryl-tRNA synthetase